MAATATINAKVEPSEKAQFVKTAESLGLSPSSAIKVMVRAFIDSGGFPFSVRQPRYSPEVDAAMREVEDMLAGRVPMTRYPTAGDLLSALETDDE